MPQLTGYDAHNRLATAMSTEHHPNQPTAAPTTVVDPAKRPRCPKCGKATAMTFITASSGPRAVWYCSRADCNTPFATLYAVDDDATPQQAAARRTAEAADRLTRYGGLDALRDDVRRLGAELGKLQAGIESARAVPATSKQQPPACPACRCNDNVASTGCPGLFRCALCLCEFPGSYRQQPLPEPCALVADVLDALTGLLAVVPEDGAQDRARAVLGRVRLLEGTPEAKAYDVAVQLERAELRVAAQALALTDVAAALARGGDAAAIVADARQVVLAALPRKADSNQPELPLAAKPGA